MLSQNRDLSSQPSKYLSRSTQPSSSLYCFRNPCVSLYLFESWLSAQVGAAVCWPFRGTSRILTDSLLFPLERVPTDFCCQILWRFLFLLVLFLRGFWCGIEISLSSGDTFAAEMFFQLLIHYTWIQGPVLSEGMYKSLTRFKRRVNILHLW